MRAQQRRAEGIKSPAEGGRGARVPLSPARSLATTPPTTARCASSRCEWFAVTDRYGVHHNIALDLRPVASRDLSAGPSLWSAPHAPGSPRAECRVPTLASVIPSNISVSGAMYRTTRSLSNFNLFFIVFGVYCFPKCVLIVVKFLELQRT